MKKDVIYIDIEDEITAIIEKLKDSNTKIVALVPPKRSTVLNSVVNLKLLKRAADSQKKRFVIITNERSLNALAGGLNIFVAKNLHSKPEVPKSVGAPVVDESTIEGTVLEIDPAKSVGDLDKKHTTQGKIDLSELNKTDDQDDKDQDQAKKPKSPGVIKKKSLKVPSFEAFRVKVILMILGVFFIIGGWIWAFKIAPGAVVNIKAQTSRVDSEIELTIDGDIESSDAEKGSIKAQVQTIRRTVSEQFTATGEKNIGDKASGLITILNCGSSLPAEISAGTVFTSPGGLDFVTDETVVVPGGVFTPTCTSPGEADVNVTADKAGDDYNLAPDSYSSSSTGVSALGAQMAGGTSEKVTVVDKKDFDDAKKLLQARTFEDVKAELSALFEGDVVIIDESFITSGNKFKSDPKVGKQADKATASVVMIFTILALDRVELAELIDDDVRTRISSDQQSIYQAGVDNVSFILENRLSRNSIDVTLRAYSFVGPEINTEQLAESIAGKPFSEARAIVESLPGVRSVDIDFDPFWVSKAPSANKITVTLEIAETTLQ